MAEEERKDAMMALGRIVLSIEGLKMDYKQDVQTIIYALQSPSVPVIEGLEEAIASCVRYLMTNEIGFPTTYDRDIFLRAARAYAELQKGV